MRKNNLVPKKGIKIKIKNNTGATKKRKKYLIIKNTICKKKREKKNKNPRVKINGLKR